MRGMDSCLVILQYMCHCVFQSTEKAGFCSQCAAAATRVQSGKDITCARWHVCLCVDKAAMLWVMFVQLGCPWVGSCIMLQLTRSCNYVHPLTVMSLTAEYSLLFGWAADPRYIFELCFIFLRPPRTHAIDWFTCWCYWGRNLLPKHDGQQQRGFSMQTGGTAIVLESTQAACTHKCQQWCRVWCLECCVGPTNEPIPDQKPEALVHCLASTVWCSLTYKHSRAISSQAHLCIHL